MRTVFAILLALVWANSSVATELELKGKFVQGGLVWGTTTPGATVTFEGRPVRVSPNGRFLIGFSRDAAPQSAVTVLFADGQTEYRKLDIARREYQIQRINGLPPKMVTPPKAVYDRIRAENRIIAQARTRDTAQDLFESGWVWPAIGRISGVYGSQRVLNGKPRRPHYGIDIAAPTGTPVVSPADAIVAMIHHDMYYTGGTIILDHGHGLTSAMLHMDRINVREGDRVRKGEKIGTVGASGRATGPHLDWRINLFKARLDPAFLVPAMPTTKR
ncbi:MAG: M23 family metallopeptidase [Pseudomonadota bacterium]|nr:M23 family metallopeptidase [Pseudomonadota bacterium]